MDNTEKKNDKHDEDKMPLGENSEINKNNEKINKAEDINEELKQKENSSKHAPESDNEEKHTDINEEKSAEENLLEKVDKLTEEVIQLRDEKLRLLAEMENLRKRSDKERIDSLRYGSMNLARDILSPDDNLTRALAAIPEIEKNTETVNNLIDGLKMVQKEFSTILEKHGIKKIDALKSKFDHNFHQAMVEVENDDVDEGTIIQEMQSGYTMHDRLLRPSMVGVSKKSTKNKKNDHKK